VSYIDPNEAMEALVEEDVTISPEALLINVAYNEIRNYDGPPNNCYQSILG